MSYREGTPEKYHGWIFFLEKEFSYFRSKVYGKKNYGRSSFDMGIFTSTNDACEKINKSGNGWYKKSVRNWCRFEAGRISHKWCKNLKVC